MILKRHAILFDARRHDVARRPHPRRNSGHRRLVMERVEDRRLLSAVANPVDVETMLRQTSSTQPLDGMISDGFVDIAGTLHTLSVESVEFGSRPYSSGGLGTTASCSEVLGRTASFHEALREAELRLPSKSWAGPPRTRSRSIWAPCPIRR